MDMNAIEINGTLQLIRTARHVTEAKRARKDRRRHNKNARNFGMELIWK